GGRGRGGRGGRRGQDGGRGRAAWGRAEAAGGWTRQARGRRHGSRSAEIQGGRARPCSRHASWENGRGPDAGRASPHLQGRQLAMIEARSIAAITEPARFQRFVSRQVSLQLVEQPGTIVQIDAVLLAEGAVAPKIG